MLNLKNKNVKMENFDVFNISMDDFTLPTTSSNSKENLFNPDPELSKTKVYTARVRPVYWLGNPNGFNPKQNYISKKTFFLKNAAGEGGYFDSPASIGEPCQAMRTFFDLKKKGKEDANMDELADAIKPKSSFFYLVYVEKDIVTPENEGKLMVWKAPIQIHKLIEKKVNPSADDLKIGKKSEDIFNPLKGRSIDVSISKDKWWNYDACELTGLEPMIYKGSDFTENDKANFVNELKETGNEIMNAYCYTPISEEKYAQLLDIVTEKTGVTFNNVNKVQNKGLQISGVSPAKDEVAQEAKPQAKQEPKPATPVAESQVDDDDINSLLEELDIAID